MNSEWYCYDNVANMVQVGYKFIIEMLKNYEGDFKSDISMKRLIQHLQILSIQTPEASDKQYDFVKIYFELMYTMIKCKILNFSEAFPPLIKKKIFPQALNYNKVSKHIFFNQVHNSSILLRNIKIEEGKSDHSLLLLYLRLIQDMIEVSKIFLYYMKNFLSEFINSIPAKFIEKQRKVEVQFNNISIQFYPKVLNFFSIFSRKPGSSDPKKIT